MHLIQPIKLSNDVSYCCSAITGTTTVLCTGDASPITNGARLVVNPPAWGKAEFGVCCAKGVSFGFTLTDQGEDGTQEVVIGSGSYIKRNGVTEVDLAATYSEGFWEFEVDCEDNRPCGNIFEIYVTGCHATDDDYIDIIVELDLY